MQLMDSYHDPLLVYTNSFYISNDCAWSKESKFLYKWSRVIESYMHQKETKNNWDFLYSLWDFPFSFCDFHSRQHDTIRKASKTIGCMRAHIDCTSVASPAKPTIVESFIWKTFLKFAATVCSWFEPKRLSQAIPTQFFPAIATMAEPLYSNIDC